MNANVERKWCIRLAVLGGLSILVWTGGFLLPASIFSYQEPVSAPVDVPIAGILGLSRTGLARFLVPLVLLWCAYTVAIAVARRLSSTTALVIVAGVSILLCTVALMIHPGGSFDIWHYMAKERIFWLHSMNPYLFPPFPFRGVDPIIARVPDSLWTPSPYGPAWHVLAMPSTVLAGDGTIANLVAFKLPAVAFFLLGLPLVYRLAERVQAGSGVAAVVIYGWNPLLIWCGPVDGHNDIAMAFFMLFSLHEMAARRWVTAAPLLMVGILIKWVIAIILPVIVLNAVKERRWRPLAQLGIGLSIGAGLTALLWAPFWAGRVMLNGTMRDDGLHAVNSPVAALLWFLGPEFTSSPVVPPALLAGLMAVFTLLVTAVLVRYLFRSDGSLKDTIHSCMAIIVAALLLLTTWFLPWYLTWLVPLGAILAGRPAATFAVVYSASAMALFIPFGWWRLANEQWGWSLGTYNLVASAVVLSPPLLYVLVTILPRGDRSTVQPYVQVSGVD